MKKTILCLLFISFSIVGFSQDVSYGLKAGLNITQGGQITGSSSGVGNWDETLTGTGKTGYHGGAYVQVNFGKFFLRPEIVYTSVGLDFEFPSRTSTYGVQKVDLPLLFGYNIWGPLDLYAGPIYSSILDGSLAGDREEEPIVIQDTPIHAQIGAKAEFGRFGLDLRYEYNRSGTEIQDVRRLFTRGGSEGYGVNYVHFDDTRINQVIVSLTFKIGEIGQNRSGNRRRNKGFSCF